MSADLSVRPAVLILAYNRVRELQQVLDAVLRQSPHSVYVSVDGPKEGSGEDQRRVSEVHEAIQEYQALHVIHTRFARANGGILHGVLEGIDWFFSEQECGVVLEDDVVIAPDSLPLAASLLQELDNIRQIGSISLFNPVPNKQLAAPSEMVRLSALPSSQYWGTWSDRWNATRRLRDFSSTNRATVIAATEALPNRGLREFWLRRLHAHPQGWTSWEDLWTLTHWVEMWCAAYTNRNFSIHVGFNSDATNSWDRPSWYPTTFDEAQTGTRLPFSPQTDPRADSWYFNQRFGLSPWKRIKHLVWVRFPGVRTSYLQWKTRLEKFLNSTSPPPH